MAGTVISSAAVNSNFADLAVAMTGSFARDGQSSFTGQFKLPDGGLTAPALSFNNETTTGLTRPAAGQIGAVILGTQVATVSSTGINSNFTGTAVLSGTFSGTFAGVMPSGIDVPSGDVNNLITDGFYMVEAACTNQPVAGVQYYFLVQKYPPTSGAVQQTAWDVTASGGMWNRTLLTTWGPWRQVGRPSHGHLWGLTMSTAGASTTMTIAAGEAVDNIQNVPYLMILLSAISKTTAAWAVGSGNGGLDTGSIAASTWYHFYLIARGDSGVVDVIFSLNPNGITYPTNYSFARRIGSMKTNGSSQWQSFSQFEDTFYLNTSVLDQNGALANNSNTTLAISVPTGIRVRPIVHVYFANSAIGAGSFRVRSPDLQINETVAAGDGTPSASFNQNVARLGVPFNEDIITNTSAQIVISPFGDTSGNMVVRTYGWIDKRGRLS